eukprot:CAMPEP_0115691610 /NCGR_PEP_ID=MMETSP0272-20121206/62745_1 /TAXON_ID=71861 /ORGANISM="Scrippsiella trochoidea, Strain CCMP3099" /LENGTH=411 /DNA_ID=CAMNT_0003131595 /DNA_START=246 /DNA_END=1480 /DNA_ORIENTATION=-
MGAGLEGRQSAGSDHSFVAAGAAAAVGSLGGSGAAWAVEATDSGGDWFSPFVNLNAWVIENIDNVVGSAGIAIVLYTVFLKVVTYPLTVPAARSTAIMQLISPQIEEINLKYKNDDEMKASLLRKLYYETGMNPLAALLPIFIQLPIFVALFRAIGKLAGQDDHFKDPFLWIPSLSGPVASGNPSLDWLLKTQSADHFEPLVGWHDAGLYLLLPLLVVASQLITQRMNSMGDKPEATEAIFPIFIGISTLVSPQGLGVYWLTNNMLSLAVTTVVQQQVAADLPYYKALKDKSDKEKPADGVRYTRASPFQKETTVSAAVADMEQSVSGASNQDELEHGGEARTGEGASVRGGREAEAEEARPLSQALSIEVRGARARSPSSLRWVPMGLAHCSATRSARGMAGCGQQLTIF